MERKLAAIFSTDVKGYSRLMGDDEEATIHTLKTYREVITGLIEQHHGRVVDSPGDNMLAEFASAVDAVKSAVTIQHELKIRNAELEDHRKMEFRIGLNVGDVITDEGRLYGDGVNIAARLEGLADPGGICISESVHMQVRNKLALAYDYIGEQEVKNIATPVPVYKVQLESDGTAAPTVSQKRAAPSPVQETGPSRRWPLAALAAALVLVAGAGALVFRNLSPQLSPPSELEPAEESPALPLPDKPSLAVLPFTNLSGDPEQAYFSDGLTQTLITDLSKLSGLFVIARASVFAYKDTPAKLERVSRELGVRYVVEGSVQRAGDRVRINAQLIDATTAGHVWAERYDRKLTDLFALQDEITHKIVLALKVTLTPEEQARFRRAPTDNLEAYDYFLRGWEPYYRYAKETNRQARQMYEKAIELDPQYAGAYVWLGWTHLLDWAYRWSQEPQQSLERAFELGLKARTLDDALPAVHHLLSWVYVRKRQPEQAITEAEQAIALDPNNDDGYGVLADALNNIGRLQEAIRAAERATRLNPRYPLWYWQLGQAHHLSGQFTQAVAAQKQALIRDPHFLFSSIWLSWSGVWAWGWQLSQDPQTLEDAFAAAQKAVTLNDASPWAHVALGRVYLWKRQPELARTEAERAIALGPDFAVGYGLLAEILNAVGKPEEAIERAEQAIRIGYPYPYVYLLELGQAYCLTGRYEEAITTLQQLLAHSPDMLQAHLNLAFAYSALGREEEAQAAVAEVLRISPHFSLAVMRQRVPFTDATVLERYLNGLRKAGLE